METPMVANKSKLCATGWLARFCLVCLLSLPRLNQAQTLGEGVLHHLGPMFRDGASPYSTVVRGRDGVLYGTAWDGGAKGVGTVFRINVDGTGYANLYNFSNQPDGATPVASLIQGNDGMLYGTTYSGGSNSDGTIFKINTNGNAYLTLWRFTNSPDGANPQGDLVQGTDGILYGTTQSGGIAHQGTVFKIMSDGSGYAVMHSFTNVPDGAVPFAGLLQGKDGRLYGTTAQGGYPGNGTVFVINTSGGGYSVLYKFGFLPDGNSPEAPLMQASNSLLYGTTVSGGTNGFGTVFVMDTNGQNYRQIYAFSGSPDGANPYYARLLQAADGSLYGTTVWGGNTNAGTAYKINPGGSGYSVLHHFGWPGDGANPFAGLADNGAGVFYGVTLGGGTNGFGTIFELAELPTLKINLSVPSVIVTVTGYTNEACHLSASTNLMNWLTLGGLVLTNGSAQWADTATLPFRFYRVMVP